MPQNQASDAVLVAETLAGNREAFGCLYDRYAKLVRAVVCGATLEWAMAADLTQESFLRAYRNLGQLREPERFAAWIAGIARQVARERKRSLRREKHQFVGEQARQVDSKPDAASAIDEADQVDWMLKKLNELDEGEQLAIQVFFLEGRDARQVAEVLGLSRSGAYALLARALARLEALAHPGERKKEIKQ